MAIWTVRECGDALMAELLDSKFHNFIQAVEAVNQALGTGLDPRKSWWCNYPVFWHGPDELGQLAEKDAANLKKETNGHLHRKGLVYVGVPRFKVIRRDIPYLECTIDLYYAAYGIGDNKAQYWYGKLIAKADTFQIPLCLVSPLLDALQKGDTETKEAHIVERGGGYAVYDFMGREWRIPDAFLGFILALKESGKGFEGLLDPVSCVLVDKFAKELPSPETPKLTGSGDYQDVVGALRGLGYPRDKSEEAAKYVMGKFPNEPVEDKVKQALNYVCQ